MPNGNQGQLNPIQVQEKLRGLTYPASKEEIVSQAEENGANREMMSMLEQLPERTYESPADVSRELGNLA